MLYYSCCDNRLYTTGYGCGISCILGINCVPFAAYILYVLYKMLSVFAWLYRGILWLDMQNPAMQLTLVLPGYRQNHVNWILSTSVSLLLCDGQPAATILSEVKYTISH